MRSAKARLVRPRRIWLIAGAAALVGVALAVAAILLRAMSAPAAPTTPTTAIQPAPGSVDRDPWRDVEWAQVVRPTGIAMDARTELRGLIAGGPGLIAHGLGPNPDAARTPDGLDDTAWVWVSGDGRIWQGGPVAAGVMPDSVTEIYSMAAGARGIVVSGGVCCREERPAIWWSGDGLAWTRSDFTGGFVADVTAGLAGFVAVGLRDERGAIWISADGLRWSEVEPEGAALGRGQVADAATLGGGFIAVGTDDPGANADGAIWASNGLADWRRVPPDPALATLDEEGLDRVVPYANGLFAVGGWGTLAERRQCENLLNGGAGTIVAGGIETALSCGWLREMTWQSDDGATWERVDPWGDDGALPLERVGPAPGAAIIGWQFVRAGGPGLVLLDYEILGADDSGSILGLWTSADGRTWQRVGTEPHIGPGDSVWGVAVVGRLVVAAGGESDGSGIEEPSIWFGRVSP